MTETEWRDEEISLFAVGNTLLRHRWRIIRWMLLGGAVAALMVVSRPRVYKATASFIPQGTDQARSGLAGLAGQFGVMLPAGNPSGSLDFYVELLKSPALLNQIARDTLVVREMGGRRVAFVDLFEVKQGKANSREEAAVRLLGRLVTSSVSKLTGIVRVSVATPWPSASTALVTAIVNGVDEFNQRTRQSQAAAERRFVEARLKVAADELRAAENRMQEFLSANRQYSSSPQLAFERERIQRDVTLRQSIFTTLSQSAEEVRLREVRDTPVITVFEPPIVPTVPEPRGRLKAGLLGLLIGTVVGILLAFGSEMLARTKLGGGAEAEAFAGALKQAKGELLEPFRWLTPRRRG